MPNNREIICMHQFFKQYADPFNTRTYDCPRCKKDEKNLQCEHYYPIKIHLVKVEETRARA